MLILFDGIAMKYRSYRQWGFKDAQKQDQYWLPETHPLYMENARPIPHYVSVIVLYYV